MKKQKNKTKILVTLLLFNSLVALSGCGTSRQANVPSTTMDTDINVSSPAMDTAKNERIQEETVKDLDENGVEDKIQIISFNDDTETSMRVYLNEDEIFEFERPNLRFIGLESFEYLDLDGDNEEEIFITTGTNANCRTYTEVVCLKQIDGKWNQMDLPTNEDGLHEIPFMITRGKDEFEFVISSDATEQTITYDASRYFVDDKSAGIDSIQEYRGNNYKVGDEVGFISGWGIEEATTGTYEGRNCIIISQGIEGPYGHSLGGINISLAYNKQGKAEILKVEYIKK